jgi:hypothetical protein
MAKRRKVSISPIVDGVQNIDLPSWVEFSKYVDNTLPNPHDYIFRGQRRSSWKLDTSLDRVSKILEQPVNEHDHLVQFQRSTLGRRGANPQELDEEKWWALGQHYGLWTPLLDWTESPFVAMYFAFAERNKKQTGKRVVFALSRPLVEEKSATIAREQLQSPARPDILTIVMPALDENARLISQGGLFTRSTPGVDIEKWVKTHFRGDKEKRVLVKVVIPEKKGDRLDVLRALNRMNINHKSLFPDIGGSAEFCNMRLSITGY